MQSRLPSDFRSKQQNWSEGQLADLEKLFPLQLCAKPEDLTHTPSLMSGWVEGEHAGWLISTEVTFSPTEIKCFVTIPPVHFI